MKKLIVLFAFFVFLPSLVLAESFTLSASNVDGADDLIVETSNKVTLVYVAGTDGKTFGVSTAHANGTRQYMSTSEDAVIYWGDQTSGTPDDPTAPSVGTSVGETTEFSHTL